MLLDAVAADLAQEAVLFARRMGHLAQLLALAAAEFGASGVEQFVVLELAGTCRSGQVRAARQALTATRLCEVLTGTLAALSSGGLFVHQAEVLLELTKGCTEQVAGLVERRVLTELAELGPRDAHRLIARVVLEVEAELDAALTEQRLAASRRARRVWTRPDADGMASVGASMTAEQLSCWSGDFELLVAGQRRADIVGGVVRTADQRRSDVFAELPTRFLRLLHHCQQHQPGQRPQQPGQQHQPRPRRRLPRGAPRGGLAPGSPPAPSSPPLEVLLAVPMAAAVVVNVHIPVTALLEIDDRAGWLEGYGPVSAEHVRLMLPVAGLRRLWVDGSTGAPVKRDRQLQPPLADPDWVRQRLRAMLSPVLVTDRAEPQHDPSKALVDLVDVRDQECAGPGCAVTAGRCDHDHELRWPDGPTAVWNLAVKSRRCHRAKHAGWTAQRQPDGGTVWHSPLGRDYWRPGPWQPPPQLDPDLQLAAPREHPSRYCDDLDDRGDADLADGEPAADHAGAVGIDGGQRSLDANDGANDGANDDQGHLDGPPF